MAYRPGETVLIRGVISAGGVVLGPGIEVGQGAVDIIGEVPQFERPKQPCAMMLFFAGETDRRAFLDAVDLNPRIDIVDVRSFDVDDGAG